MSTTRARLLTLRAADPRLSAVQLAQRLSVTRARVYQLLASLGIPRRGYQVRQVEPLRDPQPATEPASATPAGDAQPTGERAHG